MALDIAAEPELPQIAHQPVMLDVPEFGPEEEFHLAGPILPEMAELGLDPRPLALNPLEPLSFAAGLLDPILPVAVELPHPILVEAEDSEEEIPAAAGETMHDFHCMLHALSPSMTESFVNQWELMVIVETQNVA